MNNYTHQPSEETAARIRMPSDMADLRAAFVDAEAEVSRVIYGKEIEARLLMTALLAGSHVLIEDVPGTGKTTLAAALAAVTGLSYRRAQFTPDVMASDITGFHMYNREKEQFELHEGLVMCNLLLADEINRASPRTQSALLEAMEEGKVTVDGETLPLPDPFLVIATQNPNGYVGTYPCPRLSWIALPSACTWATPPFARRSTSSVPARTTTRWTPCADGCRSRPSVGRGAS